MSNDKYNIEDIVKFSAAENPLYVKNAIDNLMIDKIQAEIENKKLEVAKTMFGGSDDSDSDDEEIEDEDDDSYDIDISDEDLLDLISDLEELDDENENEDLEDDTNGEDA